MNLQVTEKQLEYVEAAIKNDRAFVDACMVAQDPKLAKEICDVYDSVLLIINPTYVTPEHVILSKPKIEFKALPEAHGPAKGEVYIGEWDRYRVAYTCSDTEALETFYDTLDKDKFFLGIG